MAGTVYKLLSSTTWAGFSGNRPQAVLNLCYRHIVMTLLRDPKGGPHRILIGFTCEFTKQYLGMKDK